MEKLKQTTNVKQAWVTVALVLGVSLLFGFIVLPQLGDKSRTSVGSDAPDFSLEVIHGGDPGNRIRLSDLQGKAVVLDFWASWCGPCKEQVPILDELAKRYQEENVVVVGVNTGDERDSAVQFLKARGVAYASVFDGTGQVAMSYGVRGLPTLMVLDRQGKIAAVRQGVVPKAELAALIDSVLGS